MKIIEQGHAGHFIGANSCLFKRSTYLSNGYLISSVGDYFPPHSNTIEEIGAGRLFETYVFTAKKTKSPCGCYRIKDYMEIDSLAANDARTAQKNHEKMIKKWSNK